MLKPFERQQLEAAYQSVPDKRTANKINILLLLDEHYSHKEVASILRLDDSTIRRHEMAYKNKGLKEYLENPYSGGTCKLDASQLQQLDFYVDGNLCQTTDVVIDYCKKTFNQSYTRQGMANLLRKLEYVFKSTTKVPANIDPAIQESFIEYYKEIRESMGEGDKLYFLDGVHPQHNTQDGCGWIKKGKNKEIQSNTGRKRVNLNGALDIDTHEVIIRSDETINAQSTISLLKMIEQSNPNANKIVVVIDNAPYYYNAEVVSYIMSSKQLQFVYLPTYSPNLNLIERVWKFMKGKILRNKYYPTFAEFKHAIGDFFQKLPQYADELDDLLTENFQTFTPLS